MVRERLTGSDDIGRLGSVLQIDFPHFVFEDLEQVWWYYEANENQPVPTMNDLQQLFLSKPFREPSRLLKSRVKSLKEWLMSLPEERIVVVSHGDLLRVLTGRWLDNAELFEFDVSLEIEDDDSGSESDAE
eukprot:TRINITY_DN3808_c0_g1_i2.p1 TRINITY_DN3808_c0_g1~~TRINITY_DN3808_c0_g1_i2.p1  ORF type:complete len:131 (+),score=30.58 TRINITY_DN3808_c0_g1_i2:359-751(+)